MIMASGVRHTTTTLASAALAPSTVTTHTQTESWVIAVITVGVIIMLINLVAVTAVLLLLRRCRQNIQDPNHKKGWHNAINGDIEKNLLPSFVQEMLLQ